VGSKQYRKVHRCFIPGDFIVFFYSPIGAISQLFIVNPILSAEWEPMVAGRDLLNNHQLYSTGIS
jgi:hypothetical protein